MNEKYVAPKFDADGFHCPHCGIYAHQKWYDTGRHSGTVRYGHIEGLTISICGRCNGYAIWLQTKMLYPIGSVAPLPTEDMPQDVKEDFSEARNVVNASPRAACALLRLALQKLMLHLGEKGKDLNDDIASLVKKGLPVRIQEALDAFRVIGNNAVHPGQIDLKEDTEMAITLFELVNMIVDVMITQPKKVSEIYAKIPESTKEAIGKRDAGPE